MRVFLSVGEPSADLHGSHLVKEIRERCPESKFFGFGGERMQSAGCELLYPMADSPVMGIVRVLARLPEFINLLNQAERWMKKYRPDVVVLIDNPGFNWHMAKRAKRLGIPVVYYVPPQIWAWATHRVAKMKRWVDLVLCTLPFEEAWYKMRGVRDVHYVGHPFFDDLAERTLDPSFVGQLQSGRPVVALMPGSRTQEVTANFDTIARAARQISGLGSKPRFLVPAFKQAHCPIVESCLEAHGVEAEIHVGRTPEIIRSATAAICVSGSVSLELLYHCVPTAIVYRLSPWVDRVVRPLVLHSPYITLVNLMAGRMLFPEYVGSRDPSSDIAHRVSDWLENPNQRQELVHHLNRLKQLYASPGAAAFAASAIVDCVRGNTKHRQAA